VYLEHANETNQAKLKRIEKALHHFSQGSRSKSSYDFKDEKEEEDE